MARSSGSGTTSRWQRFARRVWGRRAEWIEGDGPFALNAPCGGQLTVSLWPDLASAEKAKAQLDRGGCCHSCGLDASRHVIGDLNRLL